MTDELTLPTAECRILFSTLRLLSSKAKEGWVTPQELYDLLYQQGWQEAGFVDPNYVVHELKDLGALEVEHLEDEQGAARSPFFRHSLSFVRPVAPGARQRPSGLAERSEA